MLSGLLAEEDAFDRRALWRLGSWGVGATGAVIVAVMANQSSLGWKRDQVAAADLAGRRSRSSMVARETHSEARRLAAAIDTLNSDRDRLYLRVTGLEQGLDSVTGAIARQGSAGAAAGCACGTAGRPKPAAVAARRAGRDRPGHGARRRQIHRRHGGARPGDAVYSAAKDAAKTDAKPKREAPGWKRQRRKWRKDGRMAKVDGESRPSSRSPRSLRPRRR